MHQSVGQSLSKSIHRSILGWSDLRFSVPPCTLFLDGVSFGWSVCWLVSWLLRWSVLLPACLLVGPVVCPLVSQFLGQPSLLFFGRLIPQSVHWLVCPFSSVGCCSARWFVICSLVSRLVPSVSQSFGCSVGSLVGYLALAWSVRS